MIGDWQDDAACARPGVSPDIFFPPSGPTHARLEAVEVCRGCDVREACLDYALANHIDDGIWGGMSPRDRRRVRRTRNRTRSTA
jgi:WhiB family transcriptional regulator, redox-sensing transcriptional regulator